MIDLRSDTVTKPGAEMRAVMAAAEVGDDVFGEDPTVLELQERIADILDKEAALFVPSGTMGNQLALKAHTSPGDEVIVDAGAHMANYESGAGAALAGIQLRQIETSRGHPEAEAIRSVIRAGYYWEPNPRLVCLENTHNKAGGTIFPLDRILEIAELVRERGLLFHLDGARLWNASVATGITEAEYAAPFDSVTVCLSKGLGAPVGSVLAGDQEFITRAHRFRKMYGGGMRQAGILAAAGLFAIANHRKDLAVDHELARKLAAALEKSTIFSIDSKRVQTNIVMFDVVDGRTATQILDVLASHNVLMVPFGEKTIRATTHRDVSRENVTNVCSIIENFF